MTNPSSESYSAFLEAKVCAAPSLGFAIEPSEISATLKPHQRAAVQWMVAGGRRACFASSSSTLHHELDAYAALCHGWNRELKTELELAGPGRGR